MRFLIRDRKSFLRILLQKVYFCFTYPFLGTRISEFFSHWKSEESEIHARVNKLNSIVFLAFFGDKSGLHLIVACDRHSQVL